MNRLNIVQLLVGGALLFNTLQLSWVNANDAEFGRIITFDNFDHFKASMGKTYTHKHLEKRARDAYEKNVNYIKDHNDAARKGKYSFEIRANNMADLTQDGYLGRFVRLKQNIHPELVPDNETHPEINQDDEDALLGSIRAHPDDSGYIPAALDWRELGFKMEPLNQGTCGSCYAFSVATSIQGQIFRRTGKMVPLSKQQIIDCSAAAGNGGCTGGSLRITLQYLKSTRGLMRSSDYPYAEEQQKCNYQPSLAVVNITTWRIVPRKDEDSLKKAIALVGPIPISINAHLQSFQLYSHGIYDDPRCTDDSVNHAMLAVGYTPQYFILQNWWGDTWGENGYMKIKRHRNMCGLANYAVYGVV